MRESLIENVMKLTGVLCTDHTYYMCVYLSRKYMLIWWYINSCMQYRTNYWSKYSFYVSQTIYTHPLTTNSINFESMFHNPTFYKILRAGSNMLSRLTNVTNVQWNCMLMAVQDCVLVHTSSTYIGWLTSFITPTRWWIHPTWSGGVHHAGLFQW